MHHVPNQLPPISFQLPSFCKRNSSQNSLFPLYNTQSISIFPVSLAPLYLSLLVTLTHRSLTVNPIMHKFLKCSLLVLLFLTLLAFPKASARLLVSKQGDHISNQISQDSSSKLEDNDSIDELMGSEICGNGDEECLKRRVVSEVHLDYIYTQHHRP